MIKVAEGRRAIKRLINYVRLACPENLVLMEDCDKLEAWFRKRGGFPADETGAKELT